MSSNPEQQLQYSRSTSALQNRLRPQNENMSASATMHAGALNTLRPKSLAGAASTPSLLGGTGPVGVGAREGHASKASLLRHEVHAASAGQLPMPVPMPRTLSTSHSAQVLAGRTATAVKSSSAASLRATGASSVREMELTWTDEDLPKEPAEFSFSPTKRGGTFSSAKLTGGADCANYISLPRQSFLASLNLSQKQLYDLYKVPHTFFYLRVKEASKDERKNHENDLSQDGRGNAGSVYELELISLDQVDKNDYFTLSKEGITQFRNKLSTFTNLAQWEREYQLFHKIANINFFKIYKRWKSFTVWRKTVRYNKMDNASKNIEANLFIFNPPLRKALLAVREMTIPLINTGMLSLPKGETFNIDDFVRAQGIVHSDLRAQLKTLSLNVLSTVRSACDEVVDQFLKINNIAANHKMTFMERAALRSECKKLTRFLRMMDIFIADFLKGMVQDAMLKLVDATESESVDPRIETADEMDRVKLQKMRETQGWKTPLFRVVVSFRKNHQAMEAEDALQLSPTHESLVQAIDSVIYDALEVTNTFMKVSTSVDTEMYVMPEGDDEENEMSEPEDMIAIIRGSPIFIHCKELITSQLAHAFFAVKEYCSCFEPFRQLYLKNASNVQNISTLFPTGEVEMFQQTIAEYKQQIDQFKHVPRFADVGVVFLDSVDLKLSLIPSPLSALQAIREYLPDLVLQKAQELVDQVSTMNPVIAGEPNTVEAYVNKKKVKDAAVAGIEDFNNQQSYIRSLVHVMDDNGWAAPDQVKALMRMLKESLLSLESNIQLAEGKEEEETKKFSSQVAEDVPKAMKKLSELREQLENAMISDADAEDAKVVKFISHLEQDFAKLKSRCEKLQEYQAILRLPVDDFEVLEEISSDLNLKVRLWNDRVEWAKLQQRILESPISSLDVVMLERELARYNKTVALATKGLPLNKVVPRLKSSVDEINPVLPIVTDLRNPCLKDRHWDKINTLIGFNLLASENFSLSDLITKGVTKFQEEISSISTAAQQESILEEMMAKVTSLWEKLCFDVRPYKEIKDLYVLGDTSEIIATLDDSLVTINTVLGSRYVAGIRTFVDTWRSKLMHFQETLDEWLTCQRNWMYLETIFSSPDIIRQLPGPAKTFQAVDKSWKLIMKQTNDEPNALKAGTHDRNRRDVFRSHNANLDQIQKDLEDYLETKRMAFPRFYFLSNDELLEILSQAKDPRAVQPHLRKCFDNLVKLEFGADPGSIDILAMFSSENERVSMGKNLKARGNVEEWLTAVERRMKESLHGFMKAGLLDYDTRPRDEWIMHHPGQIVATVAQMTWARGTEAALRSSDPINRMLSWSKEYKNELQKLIIKIRGSLSKLVRQIIVALVTTDVHARDIIDELCDRQVNNVHDFLWQQQLRYYWEMDVDNCIIRHSDARVNYGYEYMGATSRLVITPLTDRCWLTLTGSYALKLGAAPAGPAGTGKTESSKDLAKAMGIQCVVFNCSDQIDYKMMGKLFRGLAQGGSWVCLDEFNRIDIEVLSVIAQQLLVLREGRIAQKNNINFMGIQISLVDHHVIITMNPGYAGRTELPDNLQVCFRPVSMMVPNYALIAEIMLFAEGFGDAKNLSQKMCKLYILCSEQLSQQPHYDYGLRAVKSVLVMAGGLKRANPNTAEDLVLIRALRDSNVPKFLADDLPLFAAIVQDLFPGVEIPSNDYGELQVALEEEIVKAGLQKVPKFLNKVIQMFDIFNIRFGATLVGPAGTGKTTVYRILAALMTNLREKGSKNQDFQKVRFQILNPKSITMGELYGEFNPMTQEWHDGLASSIMREFVAEESDDKRWTIFDGPIDALWIENMNTVLDDNMTLCLANGQRIKLKWEMKCLFEVNDLAVASPATVSRIGVVYLTPSDLGWFPYAQSWAQRSLPPNCPAWAKERILLLFEKVFAKGMHYQRKHTKEPVETADIQLCISMCALFQSLFTAENNMPFDNITSQGDFTNLLDKLFFFSYVWSVGASCADHFWEPFTEHARELFEEHCPGLGLPGGGNAFDYFVDTKEGRFREWSEIVPSFHYNEHVPYFSLIVPTTDTCRFSYIMRSLITVDKPVFITGVTGTGKTVAVQTLLNELQPTREDGGLGVVPVFMNFSAQSRSDVTQQTIESKLEKKRKNLLGAPAGRKTVVFVDDVNMPLVETYGAQPPVELLRQFLDFKGFYDRDKLFWKDIVDVLMFVGAAPPGGGRSVVTGRFTRHFNVLCMPPASDSALTVIFSSILNGFLQKFEPEIQKMVSGVVAATIEVYTKISQELLPTPAKFHYTFNLRDISKVFQGLLMVRARKVSTSDTFARLWVHECQRIFYDRLINEEDQLWFQKLMVELLSRHLRISLSQEDLFAKPIVFADFLRPDADPRFYEEIKDLPKLTSVLNDLLDNYNISFPTQMNLVFFEDALTHTARISRILRQPRGNAMLIGVGGSGKQSLTKMAAFVANMSCLSIEINRGYGINEFREDIKKFMMRTGVEGKDTVFLFTDSQIVDETMLEDLNNVLNTGEVSNLFPQDETDKIVADMIPVCKAAGIPETRDNCLAHFVSRVRDKLHIVLCMSPVGDALRVRCRQFPSLINCTTIDWFHGWPEAALVSVAERFLENLELPSEEIRASVVRMCGFVHRSIEQMSVRFYNELRRRVYTTPKSYLDLINLYMSMLTGLQDVVEVKSDRMKVGVRKLNETNAVVDGLKAELVKLEPILKEKAIETEALLIDVAKQKAAANIVAEKVSQEEAIVGKQAAETSAVAADAQRDLDRALPALESAVKALNSLTKADITEVKSFTNPPQAVRVVMEAVCVLLGEKETWENSKKLLSRSDFMELLQNYDKDNIPESRLKKLRKQYITAEEMQVEVIQKVSKAGTGLCLWARAMDVYADVAKEVAPKQARLDEMKAQLAITTAQLKEKQAQLKEVMDRVEALQKACDDTLSEKNRLQSESDTTAKRLVRAEKLTSGLNSEGERWKSTITALAEEKINLIGDCFLSCACISYYGGFTGTYRDQLIHIWLEQARHLGIPASKRFSLTSTLGDPVLIREWQNQGLPTDAVSVNNGILVDKCRRWPLMIDPQMQANQWLRKKEESNGVMITTMRDTNLLRTLENCIRLGKPLILEDVGEQIEPALEPVLQKAVFKQGNRLLIRLGDSDVDYDPNFKLYMTTKLPNPHYLPEVCIKVTLINFTVTMLGLEAQLLGLVVKAERPDIEQKKVQLLLQMAEDKRQLQLLEAKILQLLSESEGNILDDEVLINTLSESKITAISIGERVAEAEITEQDINEARGRYLAVATRGSLIYFVIADLAQVDPMYQYSLAYYTALFNRCIAESEKNPDLEVRLQNIIEYMTLVIYQNICRGLFEKDKLLFSSSICFQILRHAKKIHDIEWNLFLRGPGAIDRSAMPANPFPESFAPPMWDLLCAAETRMKYSVSSNEEGEKTEENAGTENNKTKKNEKDKKKSEDDDDENAHANEHLFSHATPCVGLCASLKEQYSGRGKDSPWAQWMDSGDLMTAPLPGDLQNTVNSFQRLVLVKALREDKLQQCIARYVAEQLGELFSQSPSTSMEDIYRDLDNKTPCIFVLSTGADPTGMLLRFAKKMNFADRLQLVSLGQGQGPYAKSLIDNGSKTGDWVILQNCMLAKSWMPELDRIIFELQERVTKERELMASDPSFTPTVHPDFRLYLTSAPATYFPVSILQNGVKMTNEPPKGIRANVVRSCGNLIKEEDYESLSAIDADKSLQWKKLLAGLVFFHANIQERRKFGPLGWNIRYAFDESDLETSIAVLRRFLREQEFLPWDALNYVTGQINYGGRVTDDWDRRCLMSILSIYLVPEILRDDYKFSKSGTYYAPPESTLQSMVSYFESLPTTDDPEVFGMHENANVTFNTNESLALMGALLGLQPRSSGGGSGQTSDDVVIELANSFETSCPAQMSEDEAGPTTFVIQSNGLLNSLAICLTQEMVKFNRLLTMLTSSLSDLKKAIRGMIVMSSDLDAMYTAFLNNQLPGIWERVSFASLKTLSSWFRDLLYRVEFMRTWLVKGQPVAFPLPVFFFPQGFMTASLQTFARKYMEAIDCLSFSFCVLHESVEEITTAPEDGVVIFGLYLEGARFDREAGILRDSRPGEMYDLLPAIHFQPAVHHKQAPQTYACPVYKTAVRKGVLSTTGMSTNYVVPIELPIAPEQSEQQWILAGVAALCNLTD